MYRALPIVAFVTFFGGKSRLKSRSNDKTAYSGIRNVSDSDHPRLRFDSDDEKQRSLLRQLDDDEADGGNGNNNNSNDGNSSNGGSAHNYRKISIRENQSRDSVCSTESYETTSTRDTVYRNTATTNEFSTSYRPDSSRGHYGRKSESTNYLSGSVIVNALMWPIASRVHSGNNLAATNRHSQYAAPQVNSLGNGSNDSAISTMAANGDRNTDALRISENLR